MHSRRDIHVVGCHAGAGDVVVGGVAAPPGDTLWEQSRYLARDTRLKDFLLNEPRGGVFRHRRVGPPLLLADDDPWPTGYRVADTWPAPGN